MLNVVVRCITCKEIFVRRVRPSHFQMPDSENRFALWRSDYFCRACISDGAARLREKQAEKLREEATRQRGAQRRHVEDLERRGKLGPVHEMPEKGGA
jgi:hypothetical protein